MRCLGDSSVSALPEGGFSWIIKEVGTKFLEIEKEFSDYELLK